MSIKFTRNRPPGPHADITADTSLNNGLSSNPQNTLGNQAIQNQVAGLTGRTFNRIIGAADGDTATADQTFGKDELKRYIEEQLEFAKGEWFSGSKISGAADGILAELDHDGDGRVSWDEFQTLRSRMIATIAPGLPEDASSAEIQRRAMEVFSSLQSDEVDFQVAEDYTREQLPEDKEHRDLIAQLGALLLLDAADLDEQSMATRDRTLNKTEWLNAADEFSTASS